MTTFVLVHGAWGGGWQWRGVAQRLRAAGHDVFTPTLAGMGEKSHLMSPDINLDTHIQDVIGVIEWERLDNVALVAHSYGGMVASGVADRISGRLKSLIYMDGALPEDGDAMLDFVSTDRKATVMALADAEGDGYRVPASLVLETGIEDPDAHREFLARMCAQPLAALLQPLRLQGNQLKVENKAYVQATLHESARFRRYREWASTEPGWHGEELATHHFPMATMPDETADLLMRLAQ